MSRLIASLAGAALVLLAIASAPAGQTPTSAGAQEQARLQGKPHYEIPDTEGSTCLMCHEDLAKSKVAHSPAESAMCTICHEFSGSGESTRVVLAGGAASDNTAPLCGMCHDDVAGRAGGEHGHAPAAIGDCKLCHNPHGSDHPKLLQAPTAELCTMCHDAVGEDLHQKVVHAPAAAACGTCHDPHGNPNATFLRAAVNGLCLTCHKLPPAAPGAVPDAVTLGQDHRVSPAELPVKTQLDLNRDGRGHPVVNHPTSGSSDPASPDRPFTCLSCHDPHGSATPRLIAFELKPGEGLCQKCHRM